MSTQSVNEAIAQLSRNQKALATQLAQVLSEQNVKRLTTVINTEFDTINTALTTQQTAIDQLDARVAQNPIPYFIDGEIPGGPINGTNTTFTLAHTPVTGSLQLFLGATPTSYGSIGLQSVHYIVINNQIIFQAGFEPVIGSWMRAYYRY